ncbi:uncharacterized protein LOC132301228 [Cornus florida]|uniref:uncharacterized protein LOC132301228 n=1 Tax=Cornus florida TaxID=4283 RepID=UPI00289F344E|nr:uncharacterized protein LOC132301228 [Cornus florida]
MSVACLDGPTVMDFVNDSETFNKCIKEHFDMLDADGDGVISRCELEDRSGKLASKDYELQSTEEIRGLYDTLFDKFDVDRNGTIDREEFTSMMREIILAKARAIGNFPVLVILQGDSFLMRAVTRKKDS